jgi:large subunit ribosomal protein L20
MPRVRPGSATRQRHKRTLKKASGYRASRSTLFRPAKQAVIKAGQYAFRDRRAKKRDFRALWIVRVSGASDVRGLSYSKFMNGLKKAGVFLNRKMLSEIAIADPPAFDKLVEMARQHLTATA